MQIVEASVIGLRAARLRLSSDQTQTAITLYPMVHVAEAGFYAQIEAEARTHDLVLHEGVQGRVARRLSRVYRWAGVRRLGLVVQPALQPAANIRRADLSPEAFEAEWSKVPRGRRIVFAASAMAAGLWLRIAGTRASLATNMTVDDLTDRHDTIALGDTHAPVLWALMGARDAHLAQVVDAALASGHSSLAVIYGARHIPPLVLHLRSAHGYRLADTEWMTVFEDR